ncbi:MAG TPA: hypothetical protein VNJ29_03945 [Candidatus Nitrosotenuis sp.]|nr:hypothetical protein [Candidatus Nitrosotenuis sp.]
MMFIIAIEYKALTLLFNKNEESTQKVLQTYETTLLLKGLIARKIDNNDPRKELSDLNARLSALNQLLEDYPEQRNQLKDIENLIHQKEQYHQKSDSLAQRRDIDFLENEIVRKVTAMIEEEKKLLKNRMEVDTSNKTWLEFFIYTCIALGYFALFFLILAMTKFIFRLQRVQKELRKSEERLNLALSGSKTVFGIGQQSQTKFTILKNY